MICDQTLSAVYSEGWLLICTQSRTNKTNLHYLRQQFPSLARFLRREHVVNQGVRKN